MGQPEFRGCLFYFSAPKGSPGPPVLPAPHAGASESNPSAPPRRGADPCTTPPTRECEIHAPTTWAALPRGEPGLHLSLRPGSTEGAVTRPARGRAGFGQIREARAPGRRQGLGEVRGAWVARSLRGSDVCALRSSHLPRRHGARGADLPRVCPSPPRNSHVSGTAVTGAPPSTELKGNGDPVPSFFLLTVVSPLLPAARMGTACSSDTQPTFR